jgi:hypothetical protein
MRQKRPGQFAFSVFHLSTSPCFTYRPSLLQQPHTKYPFPPLWWSVVERRSSVPESQDFKIENIAFRKRVVPHETNVQGESWKKQVFLPALLDLHSEPSTFEAQAVKLGYTGTGAIQLAPPRTKPPVSYLLPWLHLGSSIPLWMFISSFLVI